MHRDASGKPIKVVSTLQDITDQRRTQADLRDRDEELRHSRDHLARAQRVAAVASTEVDLLTQKGYWSDYAYTLFGCDRATTVPGADSFLAAVHPDDRERMRAIVTAARNGEDTPPSEFRILRSDGEVRWLQRVAEIVRDADGRPVRAMATAHDITERKQAELALLEREAQLRQASERLALAQQVADLGSIEMDFATGAISWSDELYRLLGLQPPEAPDPGASFEPFLTCVHPDDRASLIADHAAFRDGETRPARDYRFIRPDRELRWLRRRSEILRDAGGKPARHVSTYQDVTELRRAEAQLRESREHLTMAQEVADCGSGEIDLTTGALVATDTTFHILGLDPRKDQIQWASLTDRVASEDRAAVIDTYRRSYAGEDVEPVEFRFARVNDGAVRWLRRVAKVRRDASGKAVTVISTIQDVTDRHRAQDELLDRDEQLRHSRDHLARAQEVAAVASTEVDLLTQKSYWSDHAYTLLGCDRATTTPGQAAYLSAVHPADREWMRVVSAAGRSGEEVPPVEFRVLLPDGKVRWLHRVADLVRDNGGKPVRIMATIHDVTDRKHAEAALLEREAQLRQAGERLALAQQIAHLSSIEMDFGTGVNRWSDEIYRLFGADPATTPTPTVALLRSFVHPDDHREFDRVGARVMAGHDIEPSEIRVVRGDGQVRWVLRSIRLFRDEAGVVTKSIATLLDITDRKVAQLERQELERQLTQAQKMEAVGNLTGGVAHDFNNLLSVILGRLEMVHEELADRPEVREWVQTCINAAERGAVLTRSMLAFSRQQPLTPVEVDPTEALRDVIALLPRTLGETIEIVVKGVPDLWRCVADPSQLQNALLNLALNSRDAMPEGGKLTITAENAQLDEHYADQNADVIPGDYVALSVSDTGTGMSAHVKVRAFEPFFTTKEVGRGSGLGLSMVYGFVRQSGGHVKIYSEVGQGTTVTLYLPRSLGAAEGERAAAALPPPLAGSGTVVVVEDDDDMRALATTQLERLGYTVHSASTGPDALETIERNPEAMLLLTDLTLPGGLSGRELAQRAQGRLPHLRILYMSGYSEDAARHHGRIDADVRLLQKPFGIRELREALHAVLH